MKIYEIDLAIKELIDEDTGEVKDFDVLERLQLERERKIENLACYIKNLKALSDDIKEEVRSLEERKRKAEKQIGRLEEYLDFTLAGGKFESAKCKISYRKSTKIEVKQGFIAWAEKEAPDLLLVKEPGAALSKIKDAIKQGRDIPYVEECVSKNIIIK